MIGRSPEGVTLVTVPFSGGNAYSYRELVSHLPPGIESLALELPGHGRRIAEPLLADADSMADDLAAQMKGRWPRRVAIYGHSLGALLAYLLARRAIETGEARPERLFVSGHAGPGYRRPHPPRHELPRVSFRAMISALGGSDAAVLENEELMELFEPILRADFRAADGYSPAEVRALPIPVTAWIGGRDEGTPVGLLSWAAASTEPVSIKVFDGGHFFINDYARELAAEIGASLFVKSANPPLREESLRA